MSLSDSTAAGPRIARRALASFLLGAASFFLCVLTGVPAVWKGVRCLVEMRGDRGQVSNRRLAWAGIVLGLVGSALGMYLVCGAVGKVRQAALRTDIF